MGWWSTTRRTRPPSRLRRRSSARTRARRARRRAGRRGRRRPGGARLPHAGDAARVLRRRCSTSRAARRPIRAAGDGFLIGDEPVSRDALIGARESQPETFSPNVLLRPIVQDTHLPDGLLRGGPQRAGLPWTAPRRLRRVRRADAADAAAGDGHGARLGRCAVPDRYKVPLPRSRPQDEHALNELLRAQLPPTVEKSMQEAEAEIAARMEARDRAVPAIDPTLEGAARSTLGKLQHDLKALSGKILQAAKRRDETLRRQFHTCARRRSRAASRRSAASGSSPSSTSTARCSSSAWRPSCPSTRARTGSSRSSAMASRTPRRRPRTPAGRPVCEA